MSTDNLQKQVNQSVLVMHGLVTKSQQLNNDFKRVQELHAQIREIRETLDLFLPLVNKMTAK